MGEILIFSLLFLILISILIFFFIKINEKINSQVQASSLQQKEIQEIKERILIGAELQKIFKEEIGRARDLLEELKRSDSKREEKEKEFFERVRKIDQILTGTTAKGALGESILREIFKKLPPEMIERNFHLKGRVVEFALLLPDGKRIPIDSKWPASNLILRLEKEEDFEKKKEIIEEIEKEVAKKIKEVKEYIDPSLTWSQALIALPDSVYQFCQEAHIKAYRENIILLPYSMVLPLVLYFYRLYLEYGSSLDKKSLKSCLLLFEKQLSKLEEILEKKIVFGAKMIQNASLEYRTILGEMKASISQIEKGKFLPKNHGNSSN